MGVKITDLPAAATVTDGDLMVAVQGDQSVKMTAAQFAEYALGAANAALEAVLNGEVTT